MLPPGSPLADWLSLLETLSPNEIELGLERVQSALERLSPALPDNLILVAGTNGKGSCVAMAEAMLVGAGYRVGAYTSPHIHRYNERIRVDGVVASDQQIVDAFEKVEAVRNDTPLTYFEYGTLAAIAVFAAADLDVWLLEVGMGGRLDACNAVEPTASLITNVSLDHCDWLGDDIETIAAEKAGVMRPGVPTVFAARELPNAVRQYADEIDARLLLAGRDFDVARTDGRNWHWTGRSTEIADLALPGLQGAFQVDNAAAVLALLEAAGLHRALEKKLLDDVLPALTLTGRLQALTVAGTHWLLDVAHNPAAADVLAAELASRVPTGKIRAIIGVLDDKDIEGIVSPLNEHIDHWIAVTAENPRAVPAEELGRRLANHCGRPCRISESLASAMQYARFASADNDWTLVTGSFYLVGPALRNLELYSRPES